MKRAIIEKYIDNKLEFVKDIHTLQIVESLTNKNINLLLSIPSKNRDKSQLKLLYYLNKRINLYKDLFIESAIEEQTLFLSKDVIDNYRYKARFIIPDIASLKRVKGYNLLQKLGYYNRKTNPNGVVKDHRFSINEGIKQKKDPEILGNLCNLEFLTYKDNICKRDKCSITYNELLKEISSCSSVGRALA